MLASNPSSMSQASLGNKRQQNSWAARRTWWRSMTLSLWRLYSLSATVMPLRLSTAWYTMEMLPLYMRARRSKSVTHQSMRLSAAGQCAATASVVLQRPRAFSDVISDAFVLEGKMCGSSKDLLMCYGERLQVRGCSDPPEHEHMMPCIVLCPAQPGPLLPHNACRCNTEPPNRHVLRSHPPHLSYVAPCAAEPCLLIESWCAAGLGAGAAACSLA